MEKLSMAIRLGGLGHPQITKRFAQLQDDGQWGYCAIGAAARWAGKEDTDLAGLSSWELQEFIETVFAIDVSDLFIDPVHQYKRYLWSIILDLNDESLWSFEQIAVWLESIRV